MDDLEFANIYCRHGAPDNTIVSRYFQITEKSLLANLRNRLAPSGRSFAAQSDDSRTAQEHEALLRADEVTDAEARRLDFARARRWQVLFWMRDLIWAIGRWKSPELSEFISDFSPDLIFQPIYYSNYLSDIALYVADHAGAPMVGYVSDDVYTMRQFSLSPLYWIDRIFKRQKVRRVIEKCEYLYVISETQKREYEHIFDKHCEVLMKGADLRDCEAAEPGACSPRASARALQLVYTGNIGGGRWRSLALIARELGEINQSDVMAQLRIYTATPITSAMARALNVAPSCEIVGSVPASEIAQLQRDADVLVHVEGLDLASRLRVHQSFSTKIVDYLACGRCLLAVGPADVASIDYLLGSDAALVACNSEQVRDVLIAITTTPALISEYARKGRACAVRNHDKRKIQNKIRGELSSLVTDCVDSQ